MKSEINCDISNVESVELTKVFNNGRIQSYISMMISSFKIEDQDSDDFIAGGMKPAR